MYAMLLSPLGLFHEIFLFSYTYGSWPNGNNLGQPRRPALSTSSLRSFPQASVLSLEKASNKTFVLFIDWYSFEYEGIRLLMKYNSRPWQVKFLGIYVVACCLFPYSINRGLVNQNDTSGTTEGARKAALFCLGNHAWWRGRKQL
jgi:hypothetical protein